MATAPGESSGKSLRHLLNDALRRMEQSTSDASRTGDLEALTLEIRKLRDELAAGGPQRSVVERLHDSLGAGVELAIDLPEGSKPASSPSSDLIARLVTHAPKESRYRVDEEIARGGMGAILRVFDPDLRRTLAMKVALERAAMPGERGSKQRERIGRFLEEAQITGQLDHPGIVPVHELGLDSQGRLYFTMRLVRGRDLAVIYELARDGSEGWSTTRVLGVLLKACEALAYAHSKGVIHRDLKPANVMVGRFGEVYVMDWGLAKVLGHKDSRDLRVCEPASGSVSMLASIRSEELAANPSTPLVTMDGTVLGTPAYMSPEQASGEVEGMDARSDVYALGAMLYQLLAGHAPYQDGAEKLDAHRLWLKILRASPTPLSELAPNTPPELVAIVERAMARETSQRYANVLALADDLRAWLEGRVVRAYRTGPIVELEAWVKRNKALAASMAAAVALLVAGLVGTSAMYARSERAAELAGTRASEAEASRREARSLSYFGLIRAAGEALRNGETRNMRRLLDSAPEEHRNWEWRYLTREPDFSYMVLSGHGGAVTCGSFSPDGRRIVTGSSDGTARIWDASSGRQLQILGGHTGRISRAMFVGDGSRVVTVADAIRVWNAQTAEALVVVEPPLSPTGDKEWFRACEIAPDGKLAIANCGAMGVREWDLTDGHEVLRFRVDRYRGDFAVNTDWTRAVFEEREYRVHIIDVDDGTTVMTKTFPHDEPISGSRFTPDGSRVITTLRVGSSVVWDAASGKEIARLEVDAGLSQVRGFDRAGTRVITSSWIDKTTRTWDLATGRELARAQRGWLAAVDATCELAVAMRADVPVLWNLRTSSEGNVLQGHSDAVISCTFSPDGSSLLTTAADNTARLWRTDRIDDRLVFPDHPVAWWAGKPEQFGQLVRWESGRELRVCDLVTGATLVEVDWSADVFEITRTLLPLREIVGDPRLELLSTVGDPTPGLTESERDDIDESAIGPDYRRIAWTTLSGQLRIREFASGHEVSTSLPKAEFARLYWCPNGAWLLVETEDELFLARPEDGQLTSTPSIPGSTLDAFAISSDGAMLATAWDSAVLIVRTTDRQVVARYAQPSERIRGLRFSADSKQIVAVVDDYSARSWSSADGTPIAVCVGHRDTVWDAQFNADGSRIVTASSDGTTRLWEANTGAELLVLDNEDFLESARFTPDERAILAVSQMGRVHVWDARPRDIRESERHQRETARIAARAWIDELLAREHNLVSVVRRLREDSIHSELEHELAPAELMARLAPSYARALELVERLRCDIEKKDAQLRELERTNDIHWLVRDMARSLIVSWVEQDPVPDSAPKQEDKR